uniref:Uncharacterized protein n=1 Tax=Seriola lalandi dorsalis TaxID=1841481 RepID=A0A3B4WW73_SERLL
MAAVSKKSFPFSFSANHKLGAMFSCFLVVGYNCSAQVTAVNTRVQTEDRRTCHIIQCQDDVTRCF